MRTAWSSLRDHSGPKDHSARAGPLTPTFGKTAHVSGKSGRMLWPGTRASLACQRSCGRARRRAFAPSCGGCSQLLGPPSASTRRSDTPATVMPSSRARLTNPATPTLPQPGIRQPTGDRGGWVSSPVARGSARSACSPPPDQPPCSTAPTSMNPVPKYQVKVILAGVGRVHPCVIQAPPSVANPSPLPLTSCMQTRRRNR